MKPRGIDPNSDWLNRRWPVNAIDKMGMLSEQRRMTVAAIAEEFGADPSEIREILERNGFMRRG